MTLAGARETADQGIVNSVLAEDLGLFPSILAESLTTTRILLELYREMMPFYGISCTVLSFSSLATPHKQKEKK